MEMAEDGEDVPALLTKPKLNKRQIWFMEVYDDLSGSRNTAMSGPLGIPVSEILSYCELMGFHGFEFRQILLVYVRALDRRYMEVWKKQHGEKPPPKGK